MEETKRLKSKGCSRYVTGHEQHISATRALICQLLQLHKAMGLGSISIVIIYTWISNG